MKKPLGLILAGLALLLGGGGLSWFSLSGPTLIPPVATVEPPAQPEAPPAEPPPAEPPETAAAPPTPPSPPEEKPPPAAEASPPGYRVIAGRFLTEAEAATFLKELVLTEPKAKMAKRPGSLWYEVSTGPFPTYGEAVARALSIQSAFNHPTLVEPPTGG